MNNNMNNGGFEESVWCTVEVHHQKVTISLCYRSSSNSAENDARLLNLMEAASAYAKMQHVIIMGDFNYPRIDYNLGMVAAPEDDPATLFFHRTHELCMFQHVVWAKRVRQNQNQPTLDYIFTDEDNTIDSIAYEDPLGNSDHVVLTWELAVTTET